MKVAIIGASRGLGRCLALEQSSDSCLLVGRKMPRLESLSKEVPNSMVLGADLSRAHDRDLCIEALEKFQPNKVFCVLAGGPYGTFKLKGWKDHEWALNVSFIAPAQIAHWALGAPSVSQVVLIGSAIAEEKPDPYAASYCASKHAIVGLYESVLKEGEDKDFRLYSPGYMDTEMLPPNAEPRQHKGLVKDPSIVAKDLWTWSLSEDFQAHRKFL